MIFGFGKKPEDFERKEKIKILEVKKREEEERKEMHELLNELLNKYIIPLKEITERLRNEFDRLKKEEEKLLVIAENKAEREVERRISTVKGQIDREKLLDQYTKRIFNEERRKILRDLTRKCEKDFQEVFKLSEETYKCVVKKIRPLFEVYLKDKIF